ncbi:hypothetical protein RV07_GL001329 [Enterococcus malodoratus]|nr:hypothetical protein RV07_GL001329 [Enterococcus malodoratus]
MIENLNEFTMTPIDQIEKLKGFPVADEIASDFSDITIKYAKELFDAEWIDKEQFQKFLDVDGYLEKMSENKDLWSEEALKSAPEWEECREMGLELLSSLGY